jgi:capsular exopolysaccharide synthesis family protein
MSRIYEALQRADLERKAAQGSQVGQDTTPHSDPDVASALSDTAAVEPAKDVYVGDQVLGATIEKLAPKRAETSQVSIAQHPWKLLLPSFPTLAERGTGVEQFRSLRTRVYLARDEAPLKTILVSSGMPEEGKSFVTANLAMSLARNTAKNILLIDGDLRRPTLHNLLGAPNTPGLSEYLSGTANLSEIMQRDGTPLSQQGSTARVISNLTFIPAGTCSDNSSELAANHRIEELVDALSPQFDWILIDSPPVLAVTDAVELARAADGVLLVAREANTPYDVAQRSIEAFSRSRILGYVLNAVTSNPRSGSYYYYYGEQETVSGSRR